MWARASMQSMGFYCSQYNLFPIQLLSAQVGRKQHTHRSFESDKKIFVYLNDVSKDNAAFRYYPVRIELATIAYRFYITLLFSK